MTLTSEDKRFLSRIGHSARDIMDISQAAKKTEYHIIMQGRTVPIKDNEAIDILGRETFLRGLAWSTFNWKTRRENDKGEIVYFDSTKAWN